MRDDYPDLTPQRCTGTFRGLSGADHRCDNDADPAFTYDNGQTCLCREHGEARERAEEIDRDDIAEQETGS